MKRSPKLTHLLKIPSLLRPALALTLLCACQPARSNDDAVSANPADTNAGGELRPAELEEVAIEKVDERAAPSAAELVRAYNSRGLGAPGWRRVLLTLITDDRVTKTFTVVNIWCEQAGEVRTLFLLEGPEGLKGTNYLLRERRDQGQAMRVNLFLPAGERRVLDVAADDFDDGLLGSDFTYNDVRMLLPVRGRSYRVAGRARLLGEPAWVLESEPAAGPAGGETPWALARFYLAGNFQFLLGADFYGPAEGPGAEKTLIRRLRVEGFKQEGGVWTATRMVMAGPDGRFSVLSLRDARFSAPGFDARLVAADQLPSWADRIQQGWKP
jgi:hypothetical protein